MNTLAIPLASLLLASLLLATAAQGQTPGLSLSTLPGDAAVWYPADPGGTAITYAQNPVFVGVEAREEAPAAPGQHPLVLLSHGLGGNNRSLAWLAAGLAEAGAIVAVVDHPGSSTRDFDMDRGLDHWTRVADLQSALDSLLADPRFGPLIDPARLSVAGFSYGGWTALSMGGLRGDLAGYARHCAEVGARSSHCDDLAKAGVSLATRDAGKWNADYRDARITQVVAIDPGLTWGLSEAGIAGLITPSLLIGLGEGNARLLAVDTTDSGSGFARRLQHHAPQTKEVTFAPASHFTAMPTCTEKAAAILAEDGEYPICTDPAGADRARVHSEIIKEIAGFLKL